MDDTTRCRAETPAIALIDYNCSARALGTDSTVHDGKEIEGECTKPAGRTRSLPKCGRCEGPLLRPSIVPHRGREISGLARRGPAPGNQ